MQNTTYGFDVSATRLDALDRSLLARVADTVATGHAPSVLDIGCGSGGVSVALACAGALVTAVDVADYDDTFRQHNATHALSERPIRFVRADIAALCRTGLTTVDMALFQRTLHYLSFQTARMVLQTLSTRTRSRLYISVTGSASAIGGCYQAATQPLPQRYGRLTPAGQVTFGITEPVCLYTADEFTKLLSTTGWQIIEQSTSAFGNHRVVAAPCN